ncbi:hypothetical protein [Tabrizicola sp.]|uniref:hypothetical protein n=1 Tax=Tabrizicola sp. TaxID=2005166 RepID=UPI0035B28126
MQGAVLLGDLVRSRRFPAAETAAALDSLRNMAAELQPITGPAHFTRFRGDGWQLVTSRPEMALRLAIALIARLATTTGPGTRLVIGLGEIDDLAEGELGAASGSAFLRSGQALDDLSSRRRLGQLGAPAPVAPWLDGALHLIEFVSERWSPPQAEAVALALVPGWQTQADLADRLGITRQAIHARLAGAGFPALMSALAAFEGHSWGDI